MQKLLVKKMINLAGGNIYLSYLAKSMILFVGNKNILSFPVIFMTWVAGNNFYPHYLVKLEIINAGKNLTTKDKNP